MIKGKIFGQLKLEMKAQHFFPCHIEPSCMKDLQFDGKQDGLEEIRDIENERSMLIKMFFLLRFRTMFPVLVNGSMDQKLKAKPGACNSS